MRKIALLAILVVALGGRARGACLSITTPSPDANLIRGSIIYIGFADTCPNRWFECFLVDGMTLTCGTPTPQFFIWDSSAFYSPGQHTIEVTSWTKHAKRKLGNVLESVNLVDVP